MKQQKGFSIVMAIFILVILSLLGGYMVKLSGVQRTTALNAIQGARAYQAARSAMEWSIATTVTTDGDCSGTTDLSALTEVNGFQITLSISAPIDFSEGVANYKFYRINAKSEYGSYTSADYVSRAVEFSIACLTP